MWERATRIVWTGNNLQRRPKLLTGGRLRCRASVLDHQYQNCVSRTSYEMGLLMGLVIYVLASADFTQSFSSRLEESLKLDLLVPVDDFMFNDQLRSDQQNYRNAEEQNAVDLGSPNSLAEGDLLPSKSAQDVKKWTTFVPFVLDVDSDYSREERARIRNSMLEFHEFTCIRFVPRTSEEDYIFITSVPGRGCASYLGRQGGKQELFLERPKCVAVAGTILHQIMHALGFSHEHSRKDRDSFVNVDWGNVACPGTAQSEPGHCRMLEESQQNDVAIDRVPYDLDSVMHYSTTAFSRDPVRGLSTIVPHSASSSRIGQRVRLSTGDIDKINHVFGCGVRSRDGSGQYQPFGISTTFRVRSQLQPSRTDNSPCVLPDSWPEFGFHVGQQNYIGLGGNLWELREVPDMSGTFSLVSATPLALSTRFHSDLPSRPDALMEFDDDLYVFKDGLVWILSGLPARAVLDVARLKEIFPGIPSPVKGIFRTGDILNFSNGINVAKYSLAEDRIQPPKTTKRLNQHTGWPEKYDFFFDLGRNRLLIFSDRQIFLTKQDGFPMDYGYPKTFAAVFCGGQVIDGKDVA